MSRDTSIDQSEIMYRFQKSTLLLGTIVQLHFFATIFKHKIENILYHAIHKCKYSVMNKFYKNVNTKIEWNQGCMNER